MSTQRKLRYAARTTGVDSFDPTLAVATNPALPRLTRAATGIDGVRSTVCFTLAVLFAIALGAVASIWTTTGDAVGLSLFGAGIGYAVTHIMSSVIVHRASTDGPVLIYLESAHTVEQVRSRATFKELVEARRVIRDLARDSRFETRLCDDTIAAVEETLWTAATLVHEIDKLELDRLNVGGHGPESTKLIDAITSRLKTRYAKLERLTQTTKDLAAESAEAAAGFDLFDKLGTTVDDLIPDSFDEVALAATLANSADRLKAVSAAAAVLNESAVAMAEIIAATDHSEPVTSPAS